MSTTLAELIVPETKSQILDRFLSKAAARGFPVTDWESNGVGRSIAEIIAEIINELSANNIAKIAAGGHARLASNAGDKWVDMLGEQRYDLTRIAASTAKHTIRLHEKLSQTRNVADGDLIFRAAAKGLDFVNDGAFTLTADDDNHLITVKAVAPGATYNVGAGDINELVTSFVGVDFYHETTSLPVDAKVEESKAGDGSISLAETVSGAVLAGLYKIRITTSGEPGSSGALVWSRLSGNDEAGDGEEIAVTPIPASLALNSAPVGDTNITVTFNDGAAAPSFIAGDEFRFQSPASPLIESGRDAETNDAYVQRMLARWPALALIPTADKYEFLTRAAHPAVTKVTVTPSNDVAGQVDILIAGASALDPGVVTTVEDYVRLRDGVTDAIDVQEATGVGITLTATAVYYPKDADLAAMQAEAQANWNAYIDVLPIGGEVRLSEASEALKAAGVVEHPGLAFSSPAPNIALPGTSTPNVNHKLTSTQVATVGAALSTLTWRAI